MTISQDTTFDIPLPLKQVAVHVQDANGTAVANAHVDAHGGPFGSSYPLQTNIGTVMFSVIDSNYQNMGGSVYATDGAGDLALWLLQTPPPSNSIPLYSFIATPRRQ